MRKFRETGVVENVKIARDIYRLKLKIPDIVNSVEPGQFLNVYFQDSPKIFPRPFSIAGVDDNNILIIYKVVGSQTEKMSYWQKGFKIKVLAPLGNSFELDSENDVSYVLVAGGVGVAPLMFLRDSLFLMGITPHFFIGAKNINELPIAEDTKSKLYLSTDNGSLGFAGNVVKHFKSMLGSIPKPVSIYACGPNQMNKAMAKLGIEQGMKLQVSLERVMACGLGICQGCAMNIMSTTSDSHYSLVCKDGPVFKGEEIILTANER
ncbi:MAG: dihydroorotate dehydrogenase electron transfer subunit [Candidatus Marinimicrobia bacterium]|nr:dihydroorotate dehydrogenase electron transfer subunit [Candidatus Neomarinimicrobiota bacterium]